MAGEPRPQVGRDRRWLGEYRSPLFNSGATTSSAASSSSDAAGYHSEPAEAALCYDVSTDRGYAAAMEAVRSGNRAARAEAEAVRREYMALHRTMSSFALQLRRLAQPEPAAPPEHEPLLAPEHPSYAAALEAARWDSRTARAAAGAVRGDGAAANGHAGRDGGGVNPFPCWAEAAGNAGGGSCLEGGGSCPDWLTDPQAGYSPPTASEILPNFLLSPRAQQYVAENEANYYVAWNIYSFPAYGLYLSLSRKVVDFNLSYITGFGLSEPSRALPFYALWEDAASTTLAAAANPGDAVLQVACRDGFAVGDTIRVGEGASVERSTVAGVGGSILQLAKPLTGGHLKGTAVIVLLQAAREQLNAPAPIWIPGLGESRYELVPWLGCRCSWPCTQLCWRWLFMNTQTLATIWMTVTVLFLWVLLEGLVMDLYILKVPGKTSLAHPFFWSDYVEGTQPFSLKMAMMLGCTGDTSETRPPSPLVPTTSPPPAGRSSAGRRDLSLSAPAPPPPSRHTPADTLRRRVRRYTVFPFFVLGFLFGGISKGTKGDEDTKPQNYLTSYFNTLYQLRILLRSLAARPETSTDSYCTLVYWSASSTAHAHALARTIARTRAQTDGRTRTHKHHPRPQPLHPSTTARDLPPSPSACYCPPASRDRPIAADTLPAHPHPLTPTTGPSSSRFGPSSCPPTCPSCVRSCCNSTLRGRCKTSRSSTSSSSSYSDSSARAGAARPACVAPEIEPLA